MANSKKSSNLKCNLVGKDEQIKHFTKFKYLGYLITSDGRCTSKISKRIGLRVRHTPPPSTDISQSYWKRTGSRACRPVRDVVVCGEFEPKVVLDMVATVCSREGT
ncbi:hypothetical protein PoB_000292400 [Plakobranchus ocellatus]|uniref:Uncharacterized protein n=1 Tax=Plakobranchus ocellatus TaxID=259542 RepID=A0AAV3Y308_9GAST|nr:hypothetical protein PoB_000292400 [Plakobranchus ocellatus]